MPLDHGYNHVARTLVQDFVRARVHDHWYRSLEESLECSAIYTWRFLPVSSPQAVRLCSYPNFNLLVSRQKRKEMHGTASDSFYPPPVLLDQNVMSPGTQGEGLRSVV